jgi:hypothetical protein
MVIFQSTDDPRVPPGPNQKAVEMLAAAREKWGGYTFEYWEVGDRGHGLPVGGAKPLLDKIAGFERDPVPEKITWEPIVRWKRQFYWLHWEDLYTQALLVAERDREQNRIVIECEHARPGLSVLVDERIVDLEREVTVVLNGVETWRGKPEPTLSTLLMTSVRNDPGLQFVARIPVVQEQ